MSQKEYFISPTPTSSRRFFNVAEVNGCSFHSSRGALLGQCRANLSRTGRPNTPTVEMRKPDEADISKAR
ncbi:hypothetical protein J6590_098472 [Homalodisca vitripennis]|nr:hypothetical protein J6590_098472 [Homalodisca vitripennis]